MDGIIHGCYLAAGRYRAGQTIGQLRVVDADATPTQNCATNEATLTWNQQGPTGPQGDPGPPGDSGSGSGTDTSGGGGFGSGGASPFDTSQAGGPSADIFLAIDGIPGDSGDARHKNEISIESFAFLAKRPTRGPPAPSALLAAPGQGLRRVWPRLSPAATSGRRVKSAMVTFSTGSDTSGTDVLTYKLSDVAVTSYEQGGANSDTKALGSLDEEIGLTPARVQVTEKTFGANGSAGAPVTSSWQVPKSRR